MRLALKFLPLWSLLVFGKFAEFEGFLLAFAQSIRLTGFWHGIVQCVFRMFCRHASDSRLPRHPNVSHATLTPTEIPSLPALFTAALTHCGKHHILSEVVLLIRKTRLAKEETSLA